MTTTEFTVRRSAGPKGPAWEGLVTLSGASVDAVWDDLAARYPVKDGFYVVLARSLDPQVPLVVFA